MSWFPAPTEQLPLRALFKKWMFFSCNLLLLRENICYRGQSKDIRAPELFGSCSQVQHSNLNQAAKVRQQKVNAES